jgi:hypothetical protein
MPLLLLALERVLAGRRSTAFAALALAVAAKEYVAGLAVTLGIYWLTSRRDRRLGLAAIALGVAWVGLVVPAVHARFRPPDLPSLTGVYFGRLGSTPAEVVRTSLTEPQRVLAEMLTARKAGVTAVLLAPLAFAPLAAPAPLLVTAPVFVPLAVTEQLNLRNHHNATLVPFLLLAAALGARRLFGRQAHLALLAATAVAHGNLAPSPLAVRSWTPGRWDYLLNPHQLGRTEHDRLLDQARRLVPEAARLSVSSHLTPHLAHRPVCFPFPAPLDRAGIDLVLVDLVGGWPPPFRTRQDEIDGLRQVAADPRFTLRLARDGIFLYARSDLALAVPPPPPAAAPAATPLAAGRYAVGPLLLTTAGDGRGWWQPARDLNGPVLVLDAQSGAVRVAASVPGVPTPWLAGDARPDPEPIPSGTRLEVRLLPEGQPALDPRSPPQPWLRDSWGGERELP